MIATPLIDLSFDYHALCYSLWIIRQKKARIQFLVAIAQTTDTLTHDHYKLFLIKISSIFMNNNNCI